MAKEYSKGAQGATQSSGSHKRPSRPSGSIIRVRPADPLPILATALDASRYCGIPYADRYFYFDTVKYLAKQVISNADARWLRSHCKHLDIRQHGHMIFPKQGQPYQLNIPPWRFRIEIHGPDRDALAFFAKLPGIKVTAAHVARDFTFDDASGKWAMLDLFSAHFVQRWQRKRKRISFDNGGLSTGRRKKGWYETCYVSRPCRIDGIVDCFHGEGRHLGTKALAQIGIHCPADLLDFDFPQYHSQKDQTSLRAIDKHALGRTHRNRMNNTRDQHARAGDLRIGGLLWRIHGMDQFGNASVEQFIRNYGRGPFMADLAKNIIGTVDTERANHEQR